MEDAAEEHSMLGDSKNKGSDPFKWAIVMCIGWDCFKIESYRRYHGFTTDFKYLKSWIINYADLATHDGAFDALSASIGIYQEYIVVKRKTEIQTGTIR
jgi:hypothetical protein